MSLENALLKPTLHVAVVCTEIGTTEVTDETCERTCATREQDIVQLNAECLMPIGDENCTCAENFVRENGECIHKDTCTNCIDEFGNVSVPLSTQ